MVADRTRGQISVTQPQATSVVIADDHVFMRDLMARMLARQPQRYSVLATVGDAESAINACQKFGPDLLLLDIHLPDRNGTEILPDVRKAAPTTRILLCTAFPIDHPLVDLARTGADGFVEKTSTWDDFLLAVDHVRRGKHYFCARSLGIVPKENGGLAAPASRLSLREKEILSLIVKGLTTKEIGAKLHISGGTVETHRTNIMRKLNVRNVAELVSEAFHRRLVRARDRRFPGAH